MSDFAPSYFESSRRLTGPNLYFGGTGAVLEVVAASAEQCRAWESRVRAMCAALGWPDDCVIASVYASGASLAFAAPADQLFTATEVNEWAWQGVACQSLGLPLPQAPGYPAVLDFESASQTLRRMAAAESCPAAIAILEAAARRDLLALMDEDTLTVGAGQGSCSWPLDQLPAGETAIDWASLRNIPIALVTGSNGKTTTVRLVSAMCAASGLRSGFNCTDGIFIDGDKVEGGDYSGPSGARRVLRDSRVQAAVIETARGGILRRGLAVTRADAAIVTNISADHFGEYGVHDLADLADAKLVVARAISSHGVLVLNADDPLLVAKAARLSCPIAWFSLDDSQQLMRGHRDRGGATCGVSEGGLWLHYRGHRHGLGDVAAMPLTMDGSAYYNIANLAGAALLAIHIGIAVDRIVAVLSDFGSRRQDNPGRLERWTIAGAHVFLDYAHNPEGLAGLLEVAGGVRSKSGGRMGLLLGQAGNRDNQSIMELARTAASANPELVVLKDMDGYLRGRTDGEVPALLHAELHRQGLPESALCTVLEEVAAAQKILAWSRPGDVLVLPVHNLSARASLVDWLDARVNDAS